MNKNKVKKKTKNEEPTPRSKALIAQYEVRVGRMKQNGLGTELCDFSEPYTDVVVVDMFSKRTMGWNVKEAKKKMGLKMKEEKVIPYLINILLVQMQETDWAKVKKNSV